MLAVDSVLPLPFVSFVSEAQAIIGRPLTPYSVAGVARRTTRRVIRRSAIYAPTLPTGCVSANVYGAVVWRCGGVYYQPYEGRYVQIYID
ncbi:hypothetical protein [Phyllobacterium ifriqiyense]|uniref:hypothetical protein n=1 Tax=Phyllobacterium ifriqiyense TaxID=314238 RepID=UPI0033936D91